jgi:hypothetical protein
MTDLTQINVPFGLLDAETQKALKDHPGPFEYFSGGGTWRECNPASLSAAITYRVKPAPPKPREWWVNIYPTRGAYGYPTKDSASQARGYDCIECVHVREVL